MLVFFLMTGIFFILLGLAIHIKKWHFLISGYNTMPTEKRAKVNTEGLGRLIGVYCYISGGIFIAAGVLNALGIKTIIIPVFAIFLILTVYVLVKAQKYDGNIFDEYGKLRKGAGKQFVRPVSITAVILVGVLVILILSSQQTKVTIAEDGLQIHGMYGEKYTWDSIESIELMDELPTILLRMNGSEFGSNLKGYFKTREMGTVKLFVNTQYPPFICLKTSTGISIFNLNSADETQRIFTELSARAE